MKTKRERERERFGRESRTLLGIRAEVVEAPRGELSPGQLLDIERRLTAVHDPAKASACRICGITCPVGSAELSGWKICSPCALLASGGLAAAVSVLLGRPVEAHEVVDVLDGAGLAVPTFMWGRWPSDAGHASRWAHLPIDYGERGRASLRRVRAERVPRRSSGGRGCMACGVSHATSWTEAPWTWSKGRDGVRGALCGDCVVWVKRAGAYSGYGDWRPHLLAAATGMTKAVLGVDYSVRAYFESQPDPPTGSEHGWDYLGATRTKLRLAIAREHPRRIVLDAHEARVAALRRTVNELETAPRVATPALADV